ncbi:Alpha/Beta hydrolase protein [Lipomyces japonicus]|uniref:Alpha/Beta hydrolase protein n=1 Tax=Lipomyces japonicus TaxID=56871 RepID=UPI0034CEC046
MNVPLLFLLWHTVAAAAAAAAAHQVAFLPAVHDLPDLSPSPSSFDLAHVFHHGLADFPGLHRRLDVDGPHAAANHESLLLSSTIARTTRMADRHPDVVESYLAFTFTPNAALTTLDWIDEDVIVPNVTDKQTLLSLAKMTADAYIGIPMSGDWLDVGEPYNESSRFGWDDKGLRGHVFTDETNSTVVIAIKGTSSALFDNDGDTVAADKANDNLLFSCCCARISYVWTTVCDCYSSSYNCTQSCLEDSLYAKDRYYRAVMDMYRNVTALYPKATIWATGHSLGGSMAALLGRTYGVPTVAFEAPPERLAAERLHLPFPPVRSVAADQRQDLPTIWHFGNTADPIFMGVCNGPSSTCWIAGYAMETKCHSGLECVYDTVADKKWHVSISSHRIRAVIDMIESYNSTPTCTQQAECKDCFEWTFS